MRRLAILLLLIFLFLAPGLACAPATPGWSIRIVDKSGEDLFSQTTDLELRVWRRDEANPVVDETVDPASGSASVGPLDPGEYRAEVRFVGADGACVGYGGSSWQTLTSDGLETTAIVGPCNGFVLGLAGLPDDLGGAGGLVGLTATALPDGRIFLAGGARLDADCGITEVSSRTFLFDPNAGDGGEIADGPDMESARAFHTATLLKPGDVDPTQRVLLAGGLSVISGGIQAIVTAEVFDPVAGSFRGAEALGTPRYAHAAELLVSADVLVVGGASTPTEFTPPATLALIAGTQTPLPSGEKFTPDGNTGTFEDVDNTMSTARVWPTAHRAPRDDGNVNDIAILGGWDGVAPVSTVEMYVATQNKNVFAPDSGEAALNDARYGHVSDRLQDSGGIFVAGGIGEDGDPLSSVEVYTAGEGVQSGGALPTARAFASRSRLGPSRFVVCGGIDGPEAAPDTAALDTCDTWEETGDQAVGNMSDARVYAAMATLASNLVLIAGGTAMSDGGATCSGVPEIDLYVPEE